MLLSRCPPRQPAWNQGPTTVCGLQQQQQSWQAYGQQQAGQGWQAYGQQMQPRAVAMQQHSGHSGQQHQVGDMLTLTVAKPLTPGSQPA